MTEFSIAINAGGQSTRMGSNKAFVDLNGKPMIEHMLERLEPLEAQEIFLVTNTPDEYQHLGLRMVGDMVPDTGALGGIYTAVQQSNTQYTLVLAVDMPFVSASFIQYLIDTIEESEEIYDVIVPRVEGYPQGLHAVYSKRCVPLIAMSLKLKQLKVISFYANVNVRYIDESEYQQLGVDYTTLMNVNTPDDLARARFIAREMAKKKK